MMGSLLRYCLVCMGGKMSGMLRNPSQWWEFTASSLVPRHNSGHTPEDSFSRGSQGPLSSDPLMQLRYVTWVFPQPSPKGSISQSDSVLGKGKHLDLQQLPDLGSETHVPMWSVRLELELIIANGRWISGLSPFNGESNETTEPH